MIIGFLWAHFLYLLLPSNSLLQRNECPYGWARACSDMLQILWSFKRRVSKPERERVESLQNIPVFVVMTSILLLWCSYWSCNVYLNDEERLYSAQYVRKSIKYTTSPIMSDGVQVPCNEYLKFWISNHSVWFGANGAASGFKVLCSSIGTITDTPWIGRLTERNLVSFGSLYSRMIVLTRLSFPTLTSFTLPNLYVECVSLRYLIKQMSPTYMFRCLWSHLYNGTSEGNTVWYQFSHHWSTSSWRKRNLLVMLLDFSWSKWPYGTSADALPKIRCLGVIDEGQAGSDPLMIYIFIYFE